MIEAIDALDPDSEGEPSLGSVALTRAQTKNTGLAIAQIVRLIATTSRRRAYEG
jgi:hypothetical protein